MPKVSPHIRSFNAGEFSDLLDARTDIDRYPASLKTMINFVAAPQGPAIARSGTKLTAYARAHATYSHLIPFVFSNEEATLLEMSVDRVRFMDEDGLLVHPSEVITLTSAAGDPITFTSAGLGAVVGDQIVLNGFADELNLNGMEATITAAGGSYTIDLVFPATGTIEDGTAQKVYHVDLAYTEDQLKSLRFLQSVDVVYLLAEGVRPRKLSRYGTYDWQVVDIEFVDGPYLPINSTTTKLTPSASGNAVPDMTSNTAPSGTCSGSSKRGVKAGTKASPVTFLERDIGYSLQNTEYWHAFDANKDSYWASNTEQSGTLQYTPASSFVCTGYSIHIAEDHQDTSYIAKDYAPSNFTFEGWNGSSWEILDRHIDYVLYEGYKSAFFELNNDTSYSVYRLVTTQLTRNGLIEARVQRLVMRGTATSTFDITADATDGINGDTGFQSTDVGRLIRLKGSDNAWRHVQITGYTSSTVVTVALKGEPLPDTSAIKEWRMGVWSDTSGWPVVGEFFDDRLWLAAPLGYPDHFASSVVGGYEEFTPTDQLSVVEDEHSVNASLNARSLSRIRWMSSDNRGLVLGTGSEEYSLNAPDKTLITPRNIKARPSTRRGSANIEPARVDNQVLYVQRSGRTVRELAYVFEADGYKSPSMSQLASHLGAEKFVQMAYVAEPHGIVWVTREDGTLVGLTYNREENVVGWHTHDLSGGEVEAIASLPQKDQLQDALWMVVKRTVDGQTRRYIERLMPFWDFTSDIADAHFVDSALRYEGVATTEVYGLQHLEGEEVYGLGDTKPVGPHTVTDGKVTLDFEAENIILGLGFDAIGTTPKIENGAADGTAQGKVKRINGVSLNLWDTFGGEFGTPDPETGEPVYTRIEYPGDGAEVEEIELFTGIVGPFTPPPGYEKSASISFKRPKSSPLPFNLAAIMPQMNVQDR